MEAKGANRMEKQTATGNKRWVITVEIRNEQHQEIILAALAIASLRALRTEANISSSRLTNVRSTSPSAMYDSG